jgi:hypothetical protein
MKGLMLGLVLLVLFVHFGGSNVPKVLKDNKQMVYGVTIGLVLCSFFGVNVEGIVDNSNDLKQCLLDKCNPSPPKYCDRCSGYIDDYISGSPIPESNQGHCQNYHITNSFYNAESECRSLIDN